MASISRRKVFEILHSAGVIADIQLAKEKSMTFLYEYYGVVKSDVPEHIDQLTSKSTQDFSYKLRQRWSKSNRTLENFLDKNREWLDSNLFSDEVNSYFSKGMDEDVPSTSAVPDTSLPSNAGRPSKDWESLSKRSRQRQATDLLSQKKPLELLYTASQGFYKKNPDLKYVLKFAMMSPSRPTRMRKLISQPSKQQEPFTSDEALSLLVATDMTKRSYQTVRTSAKRKRANIYPTYNEVREAKRKCYPEDISISEDPAKVPLQSLLDHTALRIIEEQKEKITGVVENLEEDEQLSCKLTCK